MGKIKIDRDKFVKDGYLILKNIFSKDEVQAFCDYLANNIKNDSLEDGDLLSYPELAPFLNDGRLIYIAREILDGDPIYFGDSSGKKYDKSSPVSGFHKDNVDRIDMNGPDWQSPYPLIRFGLYLQDHSRGGGLMVRSGSHLKFAISSNLVEVFMNEIWGLINGSTRYLSTEKGDLVVWDMRLTHAGIGRFLCGLIKVPITHYNQKYIPQLLQSKMLNKRYTMFASFATQHPLLDRYITYLKTQSYMVKHWKRLQYVPKAFDTFKQHGAILLDMPAEIKADLADNRPIGQYDKWYPLPY